MNEQIYKKTKYSPSSDPYFNNFGKSSSRFISAFRIGIWPLIFIISFIFILSGNFAPTVETVTVAGQTYEYYKPSSEQMFGIGNSIWGFCESVLISLSSMGESLKSLLVTGDGEFNSGILDFFEFLVTESSDLLAQIVEWFNNLVGG